MGLDGHHQKGGQGEAAAPVEVEVAVAGVAPRTPPTTGMEVVAEALPVRRREGLEVEAGTSYLVVVEGLLHLAWMEAVVEVQLWELLMAAVEERLSPWQEGAEGLSYVEVGEEEAALPWMVVEEVVLAFVVHF